MIDVWGVVANGMWILGLAVLLAALSWAGWAAGDEKVRVCAVVGRAGVRCVLNGGLVLFCAGLAATGRAWWETLLWALLGATFAAQAWTAGREGQITGGQDDG